MPLLHFYDRTSLLAALDLPLDRELHDLLATRVKHLAAEGLLDMSEIVVVTAETIEAELIAAIGFTPSIDGDGRRFGDPGFLCTELDYVVRVSPAYHEAIITVGNSGFAFQLLVRDDANAELVALCRKQAA